MCFFICNINVEKLKNSLKYSLYTLHTQIDIVFININNKSCEKNYRRM